MPSSEKRDWPRIDVIIPALNERDSLPLVLGEIPSEIVRTVVVVDNGSTDGTADVARENGALVVDEPRRGYGQACLSGMDLLSSQAEAPEIVVFLDGDFSDHPQELRSLVEPIIGGEANFVVGSRTLGNHAPGALLPQARLGNWLASRLILWVHHFRVTDLGPFRAIRWTTLLELDMRDRNFGWTAEMQVKAARSGVSYKEVPVSYRKRIGVSKITGTVSGSVKAACKILYTVFLTR